jgi:hypothetical protein
VRRVRSPKFVGRKTVEEVVERLTKTASVTHRIIRYYERLRRHQSVFIRVRL